MSLSAAAEPVNPQATEEARKLLAYLSRISGGNILAGQHNVPEAISAYSEEAEQITGKRPSLWGQDFGFTLDDMDGIIYRPAIIEEAIRQYRAGFVVTLMWHAIRPIDDEPRTFQDSICAKITDAEWRELLTPGTALHGRWLAQVDLIAGYLAQLRDANVPVLWRPYHEMNGNWFWWGARTGPEGYAALWRQLYQRYVEHHGLHHLVWVWNANAPNANAGPYADYYPGDDYVDILATDVYHNDYRQQHYDDLIALAGGKPVALGEVGQMPTPAILDSQPNWVWFMVWTNFLTKGNSKDNVLALYNDPRTITGPVREPVPP